MGLKGMHFSRRLFEKRHGRGVHEGVHGIEPQAVKVVVAQPHQGIVAEEPAHLLVPGPSRFTAWPQGVWWRAVKYGPKRSR